MSGKRCCLSPLAQLGHSADEYHPKGVANAWLAGTGSLLGIRETRRIGGDYMLTADDYDARRSFADEICRNSYYLDVHCRPNDPHVAKEAKSGRMGPGESHGIPYRCLTPRDLKNVLVAGRSISTDRAINGCKRGHAGVSGDGRSRRLRRRDGRVPARPR